MLSILFKLLILATPLLAVQQLSPANILINLSSQKLLYPIHDSNPLGISLEFFEFPNYMTLDQTNQCLLNLQTALQAPVAFRIGGTTQDFATFDPTLSKSTLPSFPPRQHLPTKLFFGPSFIHIAAKLPGPTTLGLNRKKNNLTNVAAATALAIQKMKNLYAIEVGNEPESQRNQWHLVNHGALPPMRLLKNFGKKLSENFKIPNLIQAGVFLDRWTLKYLSSLETQSVQYIKSFGLHAYQKSSCYGAKTNLAELMSHPQISKFVSRYEGEINAARKLNKPFHFSETKSATCGGGGISPTYGAGLWVFDYIFQSLIQGVSRLYFHQGTINFSPYSFWNPLQVTPPYYGAYFAALALQGASRISVMKTSNPLVAAYSLYRCQQVIRLVVYHSDYYTGKPVKGSELVQLINIPSSVKSARLLRLNAPNSTVKQTGQGGPQIGKSYFNNNNCKLTAPHKYETVTFDNKGGLSFSIGASEAVLIELNGGGVIPKC